MNLKKNNFLSLNETEKQIVSRAIKNNNCNDSQSVLRIWENALNPLDEWIIKMPEQYKEKWAVLTESVQNEIKKQASSYNFTTQSDIDIFWKTRKLEEMKEFNTLNQLNNYNKLFETKQHQDVNDLGYSSAHIDKLMDFLNKKA